MYYYKYTVGGMNIVLVNLSAIVAITILFGYIPSLAAMAGPMVIFSMACISVIPLACVEPAQGLTGVGL